MLETIEAIINMFREIPADYKRINKALEEAKPDQQSLQEICEDILVLLYDYKEGKLLYDPQSITAHMIKSIEILIDHGWEINDEEDDWFNAMFEVFMVRIPYICPTLLRYLLERGGDPNFGGRYSGGETLFEYVDADIFNMDQVCESTIQCYLVLLGYGGHFDDGKCPVDLKNGKDISILREFEDFEYTIDWESKELNRVETLYIYDKSSKEEIFRV